MSTIHSVTISFEDEGYAENLISDIRDAVKLSNWKPKHITVTIDEQEVS